MPPIPPALELVLAIALLAIGAEALVRGSIAVARRCGLSSFFIGLAIVGFGTSTPELTASLRAALDGRDDIALGNVVGSCTMNIAFILGLTALFRPIPMPKAMVRGEVWIAVICSFVPLLALTANGRLTRAHGIVMLVALVLFLVRGYINGRRDATSAADAAALLDDPPVAAPKVRLGLPFAVGLIVVGLGMLVYGGGLLVDASVVIARSFGISELVIGLTVVAAGTSAPELVTSIIAAVRGHSDLAVGNVIGSNIFNLLAILGVTAVVTPQSVSPELMRADVGMLILVSAALVPLVWLGRIPRWAGVIFLCAYVGYVTWRVRG